MGSLTLPVSGLVYVETPIVIYTVEPHPTYAPLLRPLWQAAQDVLREAARLRAAIPGLRTPDALHAATALLAGCSLFLTNDVGFRRIPGLPLAILDDVLAS